MKVWKVILAALVIFGAGVVTGGLTVRLRSPLASPPAKVPQGAQVPMGPVPRGIFLERMQRELNLTSDQRSRIEQILRESNERTKQIWDSAREEHRRLKASLREALTAEQQGKFDEVFKPRDFQKPGGQRPQVPRRPGGPSDKRPGSGQSTKEPQTQVTTKQENL